MASATQRNVPYRRICDSSLARSNTASSIAEKVFRNTIAAPPGVVAPVYSGAPQTFLILGSDRRAKSTNVLERGDSARSEVEPSVAVNSCADDGSISTCIQQKCGGITVHLAFHNDQRLHSAEGNSDRAGMRGIWQRH